MDRKRLYFIVSSIVVIILSIVSIMNIDVSKEAMLEMVSKMPGAVGERMTDAYSNDMIFIVPSVISIIISLVILVISFVNKIEVFRNLIIGLSILLLISSGSLFACILSVVNIVICSSIESCSIRKERKDIPSLDRFSSGKKGIIGAILCFVVYFSQSFLPDFNYFVSILIYLFVLFILIFIFKDNLKRDLSVFKNGYKEYISYVLPRLGFIYILYLIISVCCFLINKDIPVNEHQIEALPIWYTFPLAALLAPIVEEILFRGCIRRFIKCDALFIIVSGLLFGFLHTISEGSLSGIILMAIPYSTLGLGFAYLYAKTNNITNTILCHSCHNTVVMLLHIILL